jgi:hypothetical protein
MVGLMGAGLIVVLIGAGLMVVLIGAGLLMAKMSCASQILWRT